ncbi:Na+/H+ antiporter [Actinomadura macrotermitis]|uniref:Putative Na(+)/H(+) exchanger n=1 Tax=Actinomadura macrotermitis TaxID=2585200 RepID=A0A7K0C3X1_9ACTN|nr:Na+/H+ antiporter [Actinomadura macrotermitis]MQY08123.1 putative Na(+)/H(+) exchanger [Actinomadura macrotermitis]
MRSVEIVLALVVLATAVAAGARRLRVPAPSLLVVAGVLAGLVPGLPEVRLPPEIVSLLVLPPLIYAAGEEMSWRALRQVWRPVTLLAVGLVLASAAAVGAVAAALTDLTVPMALLLGTVLASTDPVAVAALGRRLSLPTRVQTLVQAESLFNDATSLLLFKLAVTVAVAGGAFSWGHAGGEFALLAGGGAAAGALVAVVIAAIRRRTEDPVLETVTALVTPYAAYVAAEAVHASGVTSVVVAAVILGRQAAALTNAGIRLQLGAVYGTVIFLLESVVFSLIGLQLPTLVRHLSDAAEDWAAPALAIAATLIVVRVLWVFPLAAVRAWRGGTRASWQVPAVVSWAGARGVVPLAATLSIPLVTDAGAPLPGRELVAVLATSVIVISLVVQGFTLAPLVRLAGLVVPPSTGRRELALAQLRTAQAAQERLARLEDAPQIVLERLRIGLQDRIERGELRMNGDPGVDSVLADYRRLRRDLIAAEIAELHRLHDAGEIGESTLREVRHLLDLEDAALDRGP